MPKRALGLDTPQLSIPFCEVLEQEYTELTGEALEQPLPWTFTPEQILEPERLAHRLIDGHDSAAKKLASDPTIAAMVARCADPLRQKDLAALRQMLVDGLNALLQDPGLYHGPNRDRFQGIRFRSQTLDRIKHGPTDQRNRLILEDTFFELEKLYDRRLKKVHGRIGEKKLAALCISGGGIRSATFGLGVVQGLARRGLLDQFAYVSTVSGGGYLGGWLSAWINHTSLPHVIRELSNPSGRPLEPDPTPIWHLRTYSNYLTPRLGLLSADTWSLVATYLRNLFLTWLVFVPPLVGLMTLPLLLSAVVGWAPAGKWVPVQHGIGIVLAAIAFGCGVLGVRYIHANRPVPRPKADSADLHDDKRGQSSFLRDCLGPMAVAALGATIYWAWGSRPGGNMPLSGSPVLTFGLIGIAIHFIGWVLAPHRAPEEQPRTVWRFLGEALFVVVSGFVAGALLWWLAATFLPQPLESALAPHLYTWLAVPMVLGVIMLLSQIYIGYTSGKQVDAAREWSARYNAWLLIVILGWLVAAGLVLLGPPALQWAAGYLREQGKGAIVAGQTALGLITAISGAVTLGVGHGAGTPGKPAASAAPMNLALKLAAPMFVALLIMILGWVGAQLIGAAREFVTGQGIFAGPATGTSIVVTAAVAVFLVAFGVVSSRFVDSNKFSLHAMYRARLIRAYLGASRPAGERDPNRFTGFDDSDNFPIRSLWTKPGNRPPGARQRPLHVVNVALNLVGGSNLAWQQRKAESFTFTPLYCGCANHGYRPTWIDPSNDESPGYGGGRGVSLGTAITISGAAASPNMGYHSSPLISLLLTLFNVRLGWWLGNPGHNGAGVFERSMPKSSLSLLKDEALGRTDNKNPYVYLSDGGHFENLGLYEMVLRRCHFIVVSDAGCDPCGGFEDLGNAIRKIRVDFGIPIDFAEVPIYSRVDGGPAPAGKYCAVGTIQYSCVDTGAKDGTLIYLKPAFYGTEPRDVFNYAQDSKEFPHETTADQFFSESQFESYRALGSHVIEQIYPLHGPQPASPSPLDGFDRGVREYLKTQK